MARKKKREPIKKISRKDLNESLERLAKLSRERELKRGTPKFEDKPIQKKGKRKNIKNEKIAKEKRFEKKDKLQAVKGKKEKKEDIEKKEKIKLTKETSKKQKKVISKIKKPSVKNLKEEKVEDKTGGKIEVPQKKGVLESYVLEIDKSKAHIDIEKHESGIFYNLKTEKISPATHALLTEIRTKMVAGTTVGMQEIGDPKAFINIKKRFMQSADELLKEKMPSIKPEIQKLLVGKLMQEMMGLGKIEFLINDPRLEEIVLPSAKDPIMVYFKKYGWIKTNLKVSTEAAISNYSNIIARRVGKQINILLPLLDAHLISGDRVNAIQFPIATKGNTITIRKFARDPFTIVDLINNKTCDLNVAVLLWLAIEYEMTILISGGTASGKTVLLNSCMPFIPPNHRIVSVEDTRELMLPDFLYWTPLVTRTANPEGKGKVTMLDLLINSLRMRPDRIVLGEMRREEEARVLFEAMHTGHSVYATVHADSAAETVSRLTNPPLNVPPNLLKAVNINVVMFRDRKRGIRRILQVAEFNADKVGATANILYRWVPEQDKIIRHAESSRFFEDISRNTGLSQVEITQNLEEKKQILLYLIKNKIRKLNNIGKVMNLYYIDKEKLMSSIKKRNLKKTLEK